MSQSGDSNKTKTNRRSYEPRRFKSFVAELHREAEQHRAHTDNQAANEAPLVAITRRLVVATIALAVAGFLGVAAAVLQWRALSGADQKAGETIGVMRGQLHQMEIDETIKRDQLKPKMKLEFTARIDKGNNVAPWQLTPKWTNAGQTDAKEWWTYDNIRFFTQDEITAFDFLSVPDAAHKVRIIVSPTQSVYQYTLHIAVADAKRVIAGEGQIIAWGYVEYRDSIEDAVLHYVHWCARINPLQGAGEHISIAAPEIYDAECNSSQ